MRSPLAAMTYRLRELIEARAIQNLKPWSNSAAEYFAKQWLDFLRQYPHVRSGRLEAIVNFYASRWAETGSIASIRRAKRDADERREMAEVAAVIRKQQFLAAGWR